MKTKKNTHKKPAPGYFHSNGRPLTAKEVVEVYAKGNRKTRRRIEAMRRRGIGVAPAVATEAAKEPTP